MMQTYLPKESSDRLIKSLRNRFKPTIHIFVGSGNNGKTTVAMHLTSLLPDVGRCNDSVDDIAYLKRKFKFMIFETNCREDIEKVQKIYGPLCYDIEVYEFTNTLPPSVPK